MSVHGGQDTSVEGAGTRAERGTGHHPVHSLRHDQEGLLKEWILCGQNRKREDGVMGWPQVTSGLEGMDSRWDGEIGLADIGCLSLQARGPSFQEGRADPFTAYMLSAQRARPWAGYPEGSPQIGSRRTGSSTLRPSQPYLTGWVEKLRHS